MRGVGTFNGNFLFIKMKNNYSKMNFIGLGFRFKILMKSISMKIKISIHKFNI